jgi:hypothetical protein
MHGKEPMPKNPKQIIPEKELRGRRSNFHIHVSVSDLYISTIDLPILLQENMWGDPGNIEIAHRHMNVEIDRCRAISRKEYINGIFFVALWSLLIGHPTVDSDDISGLKQCNEKIPFMYSFSGNCSASVPISAFTTFMCL